MYEEIKGMQKKPQRFRERDLEREMKFGKEFISQMVPEWKEAYMDYKYLKSLLREIKFRKQTNRSQATPHSLERIPSLYRSFSGLIQRNNTNSPTTSTPSPKTRDSTIDIENEVIVVNAENHETMFLKIGEEGGECEMMYFKTLDDEFNKVVEFYKFKVEEVVKEAEVLNTQMEALIAFRIKVELSPRVGFDQTAEMTRLASDVAASTTALSASSPSSNRTKRTTEEDEIYDEGPSNRALDESGADKDENLVKFINQNAKTHKLLRPAPLEILNKVKMRHTHNTPRSTVKFLLDVHNKTELNFSKENLKKVEEQLKQELIEFYRKLGLLKSFRFLNILAFSKIMKKYNKITSTNSSKPYLEMVDESYLGSFDEVSKLMERVESTFIKHFSNSNRRNGMSILRPKTKKERHRVTFSLGFFVGCTIALIVALGLTIHARGILDQDQEEGRMQYMESLFPLYSLFGYAILHLLMYAANIYFWRRYKVNYTFILGFKQGTALGYREILLISFGLSVLALASVIANLDMEMDPEPLKFSAVIELVPLGLVVLVIVILICPFNIIYRSSRFFLLVCVFRCICAPLYKVTLPDFFLADQLTSQVQALRSLEFYICYYGWGDYKLRENTCNTSSVYNTFYYIVAAIPYWSRLLQCLRRLCEEKRAMYGLHGLKYFSTIVAISVRTAYTLNRGDNWRVIAWIASVTAVIFGTCWDIFVDWGLFQKNSKNPWLRDKLLIPHKSVYFVAMVLNALLRFAWLQTVLNFGVGFLHGQTLTAIVAVLEIIRRGIWNFFRLENEHLNNVGKFRAFKSVPLPFNYDKDENKDC